MQFLKPQDFCEKPKKSRFFNFTPETALKKKELRKIPSPVPTPLRRNGSTQKVESVWVEDGRGFRAEEG